MDQSHTPRWYFNQPKPGDTNREPIGGEFFATDAIRNPAEALVRESIQNSLDAGRNGETVRVRFFLSDEQCQLLPEKTVPYLEEGWPHFQAERNGLKDAPQQKDACRFLVIEDFGTTGLIGNVEQWQPFAEIKNPFYYFFRAEGQSGKGELDRGRWGIGKTVFPRSSRMFGLTVRVDGLIQVT